ncbi:hypothetical protein AAE02nite_36120 [Adhaeribacter aerolatus]|uniref:Outer membrane protein beta-barrel domain-containing protein n=1 Tax=Adhaeribacter aerolatus TaxID=670289 RepID=A0A512B1U6_9BACT|nr:hypothetical protein [Adhaeribacter aerolatus]GEO05948.1 hypothetical protein AAE02nite_36120 [Adhaeribacter aerolatus]
MSTENMPEEELDDLFRRAASGHHPEFDPEAWQAMEKKLDAQFGAPAPAAKTNWRRWSGLILLLLLTGIGVWVGYNQLDRNNTTTGTEPPVLAANKETNEPAILNPPAPAKTEGININPIAPDKVATAETIENSSGSTTALSQPNLQTTDVPTNRLAGNETEIKHSQRQRPGSGKQVSRFSAKPANHNRNGSLLPANPAAANEAEVHQNINTADKTDNQLTTGEVKQPLNISVPAADSATEKIAETKIAEADKPAVVDSSQAKTESTQRFSDSAATNKRGKLLALNRFTISVMAAPDLSTVGFANPGGISTNAGLMLGYSLNRKWSLATGIVKARKIYDAKPDDYGSAGYWYNRHKPDAISAVCQVIDIPVNIGYNIWQKEKSVVSVQTGLSSYLMLNEEYAYEYKPYGGKKGYTSYYEINNKNRHLFSIYNLSGRYSRFLSPSVIAGVEPFVKVPLAGVGAGKVKLASAGVFFSLSYRYPQ